MINEQDIYTDEFKRVIAFLVKIGHTSLMDHAPLTILREIEMVDGLSQDYLETMNEIERQSFRSYVEFYKLNEPQKRKDPTMSDEQEVAAPAEEAAPVAPEATPAE